nr:hypothetical protein [Candidatus Freyarchaeota archaeon]
MEEIKTKQIGSEASRSEEASGIFFDNGYNVESYENVPVSVAWKIYEGKSYSVLDAVAYRATAVGKVREDRRTLSKFSSVLLNQLVNSPSTSGVELKKVFGVNAPHYMGKQVIIVANKFLVSGSRDEGDPKVDSVEMVPVSDLSSVLQSRKDYVLQRASRIFRPNKGEILQKAYSQARRGLILTIVLMTLLVPLIFLNGTGAVFQILLTVDSILMIATIAASLVIHEWGVANFKKLLREELTAFREQLRRISPQVILRTSETFQESPKQRIKLGSSSQPITNKEPPKVLEIKKYVEPLLIEGGNSSEFYAQRRDGLWDLAQKAYAEGDWDNCTYHLKGVVTSALKEVYVKLTGKAAFGSLPQVEEFVCKKTGLNPKGFQQFFEVINNSQKLSEVDLSRLFEHAQKLLTDLQSSMSAAATSKADSFEKGAVKDRKELPKIELHSFNTVSVPRTEKKSSKMAKENRKRAKSKTGKRKSVNEESEKLYSEPEVSKSARVVENEAEVTNCDSVIETMCADDDIKNELKRLFGSRGGEVDSAFLVVTQSPEVASIVETLKRKYPEVPLETYEHVVNGKAQIIVSRDGGISSKIDYESSRQLEKLIRDHYRGKRSNELKTTETTESLDITDFLDE